VSHRCLVTGGSRGIGRVTADLLKRSGWEVDAPSRSDLDLLNPESISNFLRNSNGPAYRGFVHVAGINTPKAFDETDISSFRDTWQIHVEAPRQILQSLGADLRGQHGRVVLVSSLYGGSARVGRSAYSMSKASLEAMCRSLAVEWACDEVLVNAVRPGYVRTDMTIENNSPEALNSLEQLIPLRRLAESEEVAELIGFLMSPKNTYLTGQVISLDGGLSAGAQPWML